MEDIQNQLVSFVKSALAKGDKEFVSDFVRNGPIPGGADGANRYLLAVALSNVSASDFAKLTGTSPDVASQLKGWLDAGTMA